MPLYVYKCQACGTEFEKIQGYTAPTVSGCPECGGEAERKIQSVPFFLKETGWKGKKQADGSTVYTK